MLPFTHPTTNQLSLIAHDHFRFDGDQVGDTLGHLAEEIEPRRVQAGDYIETDRWRMVTHYNKGGLGEIFVTEPEGRTWRHTWVKFERGARVRHLPKAFVEASMDDTLRVSADCLPELPSVVSRHKCTGVNGCCAMERNVCIEDVRR